MHDPEVILPLADRARSHRAPATPYHAQVVHEAGAMLPDLRRATGQGLHTNFLAPVQFLHCRHHSIDSVKQQGRGELGEGRGQFSDRGGHVGGTGRRSRAKK